LRRTLWRNFLAGSKNYVRTFVLWRHWRLRLLSLSRFVASCRRVRIRPQCSARSWARWRMDKEQFKAAFAHLTADEFAELVVGFNEDGQPIARDADAFRVLWHI